MNGLLRIYDFIIALLILTIILFIFFRLYSIANILAFVLFIISSCSRQIREKLQFKLTRLGKKETSYNYTIEFPASQKSDKNKNVIIFAHYDSISHGLNPIFSGAIYFFSLVGGTVFSIHVNISFLLYQLDIIPDINPVCFLYGVILASLFSIQLLNSRHNRSDGTADNATGVACSFYLLDYFKNDNLNNTNLIIVFTGAEEMGDNGAYHFIKNNYGRFDKERSYFLIVDTVGANINNNIYFYAQGLPLKLFSPVIQKNIRELRKEKKNNYYKVKPMYIPPLIHFSTDHAPLKPYGYEFMIFGSNAPIHSEKDNINNYYPKMLENFNIFIRDLIIQMDKIKFKKE